MIEIKEKERNQVCRLTQNKQKQTPLPIKMSPDARPVYCVNDARHK